MGQRKINKTDIQKARLKKVINMLLATEIALFEFEYTLMSDEKDKQACKKLIQSGKKAQGIIANVNHLEILSSLFNTFLAKKETYFISLAVSVNKNVKKWDTTKKGFQEFLRLEQEARDKYNAEIKEREETQKIIEKAKAEGKKVEMMMKDGKIVPVVIDEPKN